MGCIASVQPSHNVHLRKAKNYNMPLRSSLQGFMGKGVCACFYFSSLGSLCNTMHCIPALLLGSSFTPCILAYSPPTPCMYVCVCASVSRGSLKTPKDHITPGISQSGHSIHKHSRHTILHHTPRVLCPTPSTQDTRGQRSTLETQSIKRGKRERDR